MIRRFSLAVLAGLGVLAAAGCTDTGVRHFGTAGTGTGQIRAVAPPLLSVPPTLSERATRPDATSDEPSAQTSAETSAETPPGGATVAPVSPGQDALVEAAGPSAPTDIRQRVDQDRQIRHHDEGFTDQLLFGQNAGAAGTQAPLIQSGSKSWLDSIF